MFFAIIMSCGYVKHHYLGGLSWSEAQEICDNLNWEYHDENDIVWDLDIVEDAGY